MKVNEYISGAQSAYTNETQAAGKETKVKARTEQQVESGRDKVQLSGRSREIARAQELVNTAPDIREEKVAELKARIDSGTYDVNAKKVAAAFIKSTVDETV